jgi:hypothetical protein
MGARAGRFSIRVRREFVMDTQQRYGAQSLERAQQFFDVHADVLGVVNGTELRRQLDAAVAELRRAVTEQDTCARDKVGERHNQEALESVLVKSHLSPIAKFARAELAVVPNFRALTPSTRNVTGDRLVNVARSVGGAAAPWADQFVAGHFPADFLAQLAAATDAVKASMEVRSGKNLQRVNATQRVATAVKSGRKIVARLDARVTKLIAGNAGLLEEWRVARRVVLKPGVVKATAAGAPAPVTSTPKEVPPAAHAA